ncbi:hypothetical protein EJ08DRAFT_673880 [Tothia fuscella]|uniref:Uncharacterized protein n=1 Tax=Tothia fuscella TaxID=1048955 RepID=A0A9P4P3S6_9PEZI|nr:hypothetical protein EJ08DRAFT_673880 [Tothia fuscella]
MPFSTEFFFPALNRSTPTVTLKVWPTNHAPRAQNVAIVPNEPSASTDNELSDPAEQGLYTIDTAGPNQSKHDSGIGSPGLSKFAFTVNHFDCPITSKNGTPSAPLGPQVTLALRKQKALADKKRYEPHLMPEPRSDQLPINSIKDLDMTGTPAALQKYIKEHNNELKYSARSTADRHHKLHRIGDTIYHKQDKTLWLSPENECAISDEEGEWGHQVIDFHGQPRPWHRSHDKFQFGQPKTELQVSFARDIFVRNHIARSVAMSPYQPADWRLRQFAEKALDAYQRMIDDLHEQCLETYGQEWFEYESEVAKEWRESREGKEFLKVKEALEVGEEFKNVLASEVVER